MVLESTFDDTLKATREGTLDLIKPVMTSTLGLCVAIIKWIPAALAFCAKRTINDSTRFALPRSSCESAPSISAYSSITTMIRGSVSSSGAGSSESFSLKKGSKIGLPAFLALIIFSLKPSIFLTPNLASNEYLLSISLTDHQSALAASFMSVITGVSKCGISA